MWIEIVTPRSSLCNYQLLKAYNLLEGHKICVEKDYQRECDSASPNPPCTLPINVKGMVTYEVYIPGTYCRSKTSSSGLKDSKESVVQSTETDLTMTRLLIGYGGTIIVLDIIDTDAAPTTQASVRALDVCITDHVLVKGER